MEKNKENFKLLVFDFNINGNEIQSVGDEITVIENFNDEIMEVP